MKYVLAQKPEKHNGGVFFEHEIHFVLEGDGARFSSTRLRAQVEAFIAENIGAKHSDFRVSVSLRWNREAKTISSYGQYHMSAVATVKARFVDKNKALRFKLSWPH